MGLVNRVQQTGIVLDHKTWQNHHFNHPFMFLRQTLDKKFLNVYGDIQVSMKQRNTSFVCIHTDQYIHIRSKYWPCSEWILLITNCYALAFFTVSLTLLNDYWWHDRELYKFCCTVWFYWPSKPSIPNKKESFM